MSRELGSSVSLTLLLGRRARHLFNGIEHYARIGQSNPLAIPSLTFRGSTGIAELSHIGVLYITLPQSYSCPHVLLPETSGYGVSPLYVQTMWGSHVFFLGIPTEGVIQEHQPENELSVRVAFEGPLVDFLPRSLHRADFDENGHYLAD